METLEQSDEKSLGPAGLHLLPTSTSTARWHIVIQGESVNTDQMWGASLGLQDLWVSAHTLNNIRRLTVTANQVCICARSPGWFWGKTAKWGIKRSMTHARENLFCIFKEAARRAKGADCRSYPSLFLCVSASTPGEQSDHFRVYLIGCFSLHCCLFDGSF